MLLQKIRRKAGFAFIELMIVTAIFGILAAIVIPAFLAATYNNNDNGDKNITVQEEVIQQPQKEEHQQEQVQKDESKGESNKL
jgi:prepilin-type N-terminal cleavage/methylation domain-containing protein